MLQTMLPQWLHQRQKTNVNWMRECSRVLALTLWICLIKKKKEEEEKRTLELSLCNEVWIKTVVIFCITAKINTFIHCIWTVLMTTKKALWGCMSCVGTAGILHLWLALGRLGCWDTTVGITCPRGHILTQRGLMTLLCYITRNSLNAVDSI